jgi:hypothetical protein
MEKQKTRWNYLLVGILNLSCLSCSNISNDDVDDFGMSTSGWAYLPNLRKDAYVSAEMLKKSSLRRIVVKSSVNRIAIHLKVDGRTYDEILDINKSTHNDSNKRMFVFNKNNKNTGYHQWNTTRYFDSIICKSKSENLNIWTSINESHFRFYQAEFSRIGLFDYRPCTSHHH